VNILESCGDSFVIDDLFIGGDEDVMRCTGAGRQPGAALQDAARLMVRLHREQE